MAISLGPRASERADPMRVLVTGGAGFIGSNLVRALVQHGHHVTVVDNLATAWSLRLIGDVADHIEFIHCDIRLVEDLERVGPGPFDRVYHLAASFANSPVSPRADSFRFAGRPLPARLKRRQCSQALGLLAHLDAQLRRDRFAVDDPCAHAA